MTKLPRSNPSNSLSENGCLSNEERTVATPCEPTWHDDLAQAIRSPGEQLHRLRLDDGAKARQAPETNSGGRKPTGAAEFSLLVPLSFVERMQPGNRQDPLLLQVLPLPEERDTVAGFVSDAVDDASARRSPGLLQKYAGRALLVTTGSCAVHCRYCFRREYPYGEEPRRLDDWTPALESLRNDSSIREVILSGGDPLMLTDRRLEQLCERISDISHVDRNRIHTRLPIVLPARVTDCLLGLFNGLRPQTIFVVHANHANEIQHDCVAALKKLVTAGFPVLNQTVLLRGINDSAVALEQLSLALVNIGVMPYYLHQLDRVAGTAHFEVSPEAGRRLIEELRSRLPGYAVPEYVREISGELSKIPVSSFMGHSS